MSPLQLVIHMVQDCNAEEQGIHLDKTNKRQSVTACGYCFSFLEYIAVQKGMYNPKTKRKDRRKIKGYLRLTCGLLITVF